MNGRLFINNFSTTLAGSAAASATSLSLSSIARLEDLAVREPAIISGNAGAGAEYPDSGKYVALTLEPDGGADTAADIEIVYVYRVVGAGGAQDLLVTRGEEGTTAKDWAAGAIVSARYTAGAAAPFLFPYGENFDGSTRYRLDMSPSAGQPPAAGLWGGDVGFANQVNISPAITLCYGGRSVNIGTGGAGDGEQPTATFANSDNIVNIGGGGVYGYGTGGSNTDSINIGGGSAGGQKSTNIGGGGSGPFSFNAGSGGAFPGATQEVEGSFNWGDQGSYEFGSINLGSGGGGPGSEGGITIGRNSSGGTGGGIAIGFNTDNVTFTAGVAIGSNAANTANNQVHAGDRDLELGSATSSRGVHLYSPDGTRYKITVDNTGAVTAAADPIV